MSTLATPVARTCAMVRARLGLSGKSGWRKLGMIAFCVYLLKGLCWIAVGYIAFRR